MNQNNHGHGQPRRNSTSFNRHGGNHSGRPNHQHGHQRWQNRYAKDYGREYESNFGHGDCSVGNSGSPKEPTYLPHGHGFPKPPPLSPVVNRNNHVPYGNEASGIQDWRHISHSQGPADRRHIGGPGGSQQERRHTMGNSFQHSGDRRHPNNLMDRRHISPPLHINVCDNTTTLLTTSAQSEHPHVSQFAQRRHMPRGDMRVSPVHLQHSPPFYRQTSDESIKSESPSRKRRRLSRSGHHQLLEHPSQPPSPPRRSPRQHPPVVHNMQGSPPLRRARYRDRDFNHGHHPAFLPSSPPGGPAHPHQSTVMMDINQVPVTIPINHEPIWSYSPGPHIPLCSAPPGAPPHLHTCHVHNLYSPQFSQNCLQVQPQFPNCMPHHHHHQPYGGFPSPPSALPVTGQHYTHQHLQPQRPDALELDLLSDHHTHSALHGASSIHVPPLQVSPPTPLFLPEPRGGQLDLLHARARRRPPPTRTRWHHNLAPLPAPPQYSGFLLHFLAMFSNPPMSPFSQTDRSSSDSTETENYEALLNLAERLGEAKPRGLAKLEIEQLVSYKFNADTHQGDQTSCVVCMCDFEARQLLRVLPCSHEFHAKCVDKWLRSNRTCPICRGNASEYFNNSD